MDIILVEGNNELNVALTPLITQYNVVVTAPSRVSPGQTFSVTFQIDIPLEYAYADHALDARLMGPQRGAAESIMAHSGGRSGRIVITSPMRAIEAWTGEPLASGIYNLQTRFYKGWDGAAYIWDWENMVTIQVGG